MKEEEIRDGDIVEIDYIEEFTKEHINEGKALVLWRGFNNQPLIIRLDKKEYYPMWSCYEHISKVVGHIPIGQILKEQAESEGGTGTTLSEKNCKTCGQNCAIKHYGCSNWTPICEPFKAESEDT